MQQANGSGVLARLGIARPEARAWAWYDWANSAVYTVVVTAVFPQFFANVLGRDLEPAQATRYLSLANTVSLAFVALGAIFLGSVADARGIRKRLLALFAGVGIVATAGLFLLRPGDVLAGMVLYGCANFGVAMSVVFYDSLLPHVAAEGKEDALSSTGFAFGYVGGGLLLALSSWIALAPGTFGIPPGEDTGLSLRLGFLLVAVWWALFMIPILRRVPEPPALGQGANHGQPAWRRALHLWSELRRYPQAFMLLLAFLLYSDGINTIIRMSSVYADEIGIPIQTTLMVFLAIQFVGVPFTLLLGRLAGRFGAKRVVLGGIGVFVGITFFGYGLETSSDFWILGLSVACVMGGVQALSRSMFARMIPKQKSGEFFGFFALGEKVGGVLGPAVFFLSSSLFGSSRIAILSIFVFFVAGGLLLMRVDVKAGEVQANADEVG